MTLFWKSKILLAKVETTYGTDSAPVGATDAVLAQNVTFRPQEGEDAPRNLERPWLGADASIPVNVRARISFSVDLAGSGTAGTAPAWGSLLRACGCSQVVSAGSSVAYAPATDNHASATIHFFIGGTRHVLTGARGNARIVIGAQAIPRIEFEFTGIYNAPSEQTRPVPAFTAWRAPVAATRTNTPTFTINAVATVLRELNFDLGNSVEPRLLVGLDAILIPARSETISARVQAVALSTLNPYALALARTSVATNLVHGTVAGNIATLAFPVCEVRLTQALEQSQNLAEWPLTLVPLPASGNDQWSLTLT